MQRLTTYHKRLTSLAVLGFLCGSGLLFALLAQTAGTLPDSLRDAAQDTAATTEAPRQRAGSRSGVEGPVKYWADNIRFSLPKQTTYLEGNVRIEYLNTKLTAGVVDIDWTQNIMVARGIADTTDSLGNPVFKGLPVLEEKGERPIYGSQLTYDFKNNRGKILQGRTEMQPGYYRGSDIRKVGQETLLIEDGYFTTCDAEHPHFYFKSRKMRVRLNKTAVVKPVTLYIADVPLIGVPFAIFSLRRGRRSGVILPTFNESSAGGRSLERFGYYWAPSDYWDFTYLSSFYEKTGFLFSGDFRYKKRYLYEGKVTGNYQPKDVRTGERKERWELSFNHFQKVGQTLTIRGDGRFVSDQSFFRQYHSDFEQRTNQTLSTTASIRKTLPGSRVLSLNLRRVENLQTEQIDFTFPDLSYSQPSRSLFKAKGSDRSWYHNIKYGYSSNLKATGQRIAKLDPATNERTGFERTLKSGWRHQITPTFSTKILKYINFAPRMTFEELWVPEYLEYRFDDTTREIVADTVSSFRARHLLNGIGANFSTTLYGLFEIPFSPLKIIRHKMDPTIGLSYAPDYTDPSFGYFQEVRDSTGTIQQKDRFAYSVFGGSPGNGEQRRLDLRLNNLFQGKVIRNGEEKKIDLFRANLNTSYNFARKNFDKWDFLRTSIQAKPTRTLNITFNSTHSFYKLDAQGNQQDEFVWSDGFALPHLRDWRTQVSYNLDLRPPQKSDDTSEPPADSLSNDPLADNPIRNRDSNIPGDTRFQDYEPLDMPWNVSMNFSFSYSEDQRGNIVRRFNTGINARLQLTKNWQISYSNRLNIVEKEIVDQRFNITRDLHCWQMSFQWSPNPNFSFYRLEIRVKEDMLRDLKLSKTTSGRTAVF